MSNTRGAVATFAGVLLLGVIGCQLTLADLAVNDCTAACDASAASTGMATFNTEFCSSQGLTYNTTSLAVSWGDCYLRCGVAVLYPGPCGCPNFCRGGGGTGECVETDEGNETMYGRQCLCPVGWQGPDCSGVQCPQNDCSGNGICQISTEGNLTQHRCLCDFGFTGPDCSNAAFTGMPTTPWASAAEKLTEWGGRGAAYPAYNYSYDPYGDDHPIFNRSELLLIHVFIRPPDLTTLLEPTTLFNQSYASANVTVRNRVLFERMDHVGFKVKGTKSRNHQKKGWKISFDKWTKSGRRLYGLPELGMKGGSEARDSILIGCSFVTMARGLGLPVERCSWALLYINDIFMGLYLIQESVDTSEFLQSRGLISGATGAIHSEPNAMMSFFGNLHLHYFGDNVTVYAEEAGHTWQGNAIPHYDWVYGQSNWTSMLSFFKFLNSTLTAPPPTNSFPIGATTSTANDTSLLSPPTPDDPKQFFNLSESMQSLIYSRLNAVADIDSFMRFMMVESYLMAEDNMGRGNNYYLFTTNVNSGISSSSSSSSSDSTAELGPSVTRWRLLEHDFDKCLIVEPDTTINRNVYAYMQFYDVTNPHYWNPVMATGLSLPNVRENVTKTFGAWVEAQETVVSFDVLYQRIATELQPWVGRDLMWQLAYNTLLPEWASDVNHTVSFLKQRVQEVKQQLEGWSPSTLAPGQVTSAPGSNADGGGNRTAAAANDPNAAVVAGAVIGAVAGVVLLGAVAFGIVRFHRLRRPTAAEYANEDTNLRYEGGRSLATGDDEKVMTVRKSEIDSSPPPPLPHQEPKSGGGYSTL